MSIYSETQDLAGYLTLVRNIDENPSYYPPEIVLQGLYMSGQYKVLEYTMVQHDDMQSLISFTGKVLAQISRYLTKAFDGKYVARFNTATYDPTIQFYRDETFLGFLDLPSCRFYYQEPTGVADTKKEIGSCLKRISRLENRKRKVISDYDYRTKDGVEKAIAYVVRKNNAKQATVETAEIDRKISAVQKKMVELQTKLKEEEQRNAETLSQIEEISSFLLNGPGIGSVPIENSKEDRKQ